MGLHVREGLAPRSALPLPSNGSRHTALPGAPGLRGLEVGWGRGHLGVILNAMRAVLCEGSGALGPGAGNPGRGRGKALKALNGEQRWLRRRWCVLAWPMGTAQGQASGPEVLLPLGEEVVGPGEKRGRLAGKGEAGCVGWLGGGGASRALGLIQPRPSLCGVRGAGQLCSRVLDRCRDLTGGWRGGVCRWVWDRPRRCDGGVTFWGGGVEPRGAVSWPSSPAHPARPVLSTCRGQMEIYGGGSPLTWAPAGRARGSAQLLANGWAALSQPPRSLHRGGAPAPSGSREGVPRRPPEEAGGDVGWQEPGCSGSSCLREWGTLMSPVPLWGTGRPWP